MKKLLSSIYEVNGKQELAVWIEGQESEVLNFNVVEGKIERKQSNEEKINKFKVGDKVRVKKDLKQKEMLEQYLACDPMNSEEKKYVIDFYSDTETIHILKDACDGHFSTKGFDYVLINYLLELVEEI